MRSEVHNNKYIQRTIIIFQLQMLLPLLQKNYDEDLREHLHELSMREIFSSSLMMTLIFLVFTSCFSYMQKSVLATGQSGPSCSQSVAGRGICCRGIGSEHVK